MDLGKALPNPFPTTHLRIDLSKLETSVQLTPHYLKALSLDFEVVI